MDDMLENDWWMAPLDHGVKKRQWQVVTLLSMKTKQYSGFCSAWSGEEHFRQNVQQMQKPWGQNKLGVLKKQEEF